MATEQKPILEVRNLQKYYPIGRGLLGRFSGSPEQVVRAVDGVSFKLQQGEILGLVGESGSGKSTTALSVLGLIPHTDGDVLFDNEAVTESATGKKRRELRRKMQMIFQDPYETLNPRQTIYQIVVEPLEVHSITRDKVEKHKRVIEALAQAGLKPPENYLQRYPDELSGGQRQRVAIAAALILKPELLVADEPVSMLDVSIRAEILNLLRQLRDEQQISILYITHDLATAGYFTDRIAVMYLGRIVEIGATKDILQNPQHPYTKALISVIPVPNPRLRRERVLLQGEIPNPINIPSGCRFHPRCPIAIDECRKIDPRLMPTNSAHQTACIRVK
ncbi:MAG: ABC transporter ATP-binding protein [Chloroflexi bacterium]|nr:ABC transporter ATP-binding protein [Chloroflexota bacterium]MCC6892180.1 ABC transporter ATP-binding protein [Anaerolineae bacterium]